VAGGNQVPAVMPIGGTFVGNAATAGPGLGTVAQVGPSILDKTGMVLVAPVP
jgi:hypothetical protein